MMSNDMNNNFVKLWIMDKTELWYNKVIPVSKNHVMKMYKESGG
jgi:hypothetical protein